MYYGAISTDIRKSSTNWNLFPEWMQKAVNYTNNITEFVFNDTNLFNGIILPNSPEGDAYTFYYRHENKDDLIKGMKTVASVLQLALLEAIYLYRLRHCINQSTPTFDDFSCLMFHRVA